ncbi:HAD-superfamily hydrolase, subfamily IA, variant 3 protein family [Shewanella benthica]|uniref:HAD-superfamily hydrolase, subfamily IA, variant 3 protein family n=1 Tax=Shewanella benthica TaxID=43661 RepID=A0A330LZ67_9GAMM|nr:hypothetical protein [Shewanella benthica]SQH74888.1 HAD-superfamily hydrolase, subfamily IA, variant 3 protein family [Shewanella benthica]
MTSPKLTAVIFDMDGVVGYWYQRFSWDNYDNEHTTNTLVAQRPDRVTKFPRI